MTDLGSAAARALACLDLTDLDDACDDAAIAASRMPAASGVALTATLPVEVFRKSAPPASASSAARRISSGSSSSPVSRIAFSWRRPAASLTS